MSDPLGNSDPGDPEISAILDRARRRVGTVLLKWRLDQLIGVGGMAAVYAATHRAGHRVAIKLLHSELAPNDAVRTRFVREPYVANRIKHPAAVAVLDDDVSPDNEPFFVMELLEGETLDSIWERQNRQLPESDVLWVAEQLLDVLAVAHDEGIVHRDIKPQNVFVTADEGLKILDFGIARIADAYSSSPTKTGGMIGTPSFMAPEQARGRWKEVGPHTDLWAVGATMFTLLTGRMVHEAETLNEQLLSAMTKPATPIGDLLPELAPDTAALVDRALAFDPQDRFADARGMLTAVRRALKERGAARSPALTPRARGSGGENATQEAVAPEVAVTTPVSNDEPPLAKEPDRDQLAGELPPTAPVPTGFDKPAPPAVAERSARAVAPEPPLLISNISTGPVYQTADAEDAPKPRRLLPWLMVLAVGAVGVAAVVMLAHTEPDDPAATVEHSGPPGRSTAATAERGSAAAAAGGAAALAEETATAANDAGAPPWLELRERAGKLTRQEELDEARRLLRRAVDLQRDEVRAAKAAGKPAFREASLAYADSLEALADVLMRQADFPTAEATLRDALAARREVLGDADPSVVRVRNALARAVAKRRGHDEATQRTGARARPRPTATAPTQPSTEYW